MDLSQYINFSVVLNKATTSPSTKFVDTGTYPGGVPITITGFFIITQPDGLSVQDGSFGAPSIFWNSGALTQPTTELRLNAANTFQSGTYSIQYFIRATGYDDTELTKSFNLCYTPAIQVLTKGFDLFTPDLLAIDATSYGQANMTLTSLLQIWSGTIITVEGSSQNISGTGMQFDLAYLGDYYDSRYDISLTANPQYTLSTPTDWVTLIDKLVTTTTYYAEIPPTLADLLDGLTALKVKIDGCICGKKCGCTECETDKANYLLAVSIYTHLVERGRIDDVSGLSLYVLQLQKIINNCVTPSYINTNGVIPAYDWGAGGGGSTAWADITGKPSTISYEWVVGDMGFPGNGSTTFTNANFANAHVSQITMFRNGLPQPNTNLGNGNTYFTKASQATNIIGFSATLSTGEEILISIAPL